MKRIPHVLVLAVLILGSCTLWDKDESGIDTPSHSEIVQFQRIFMSSYYAERGGSPIGARALTPFLSADRGSSSRATVPVGRLTTASFGSLAPATFADYPEPGQATSFTATLVDGTSGPIAVYDIVATTTYPATDIRNNYIEEYYILDLGKGGTEFFSPDTPDGIWTVDDQIIKPLGASPSDGYVQDQKHRIRQILAFDDGTTRTETIVDATDFTAQTPRFDPTSFSIEGSYDLSQAFVPAAVEGTDESVLYSSVVMYHVTPSTNPNFWFWQGSVSQDILGVRYYTEAVDPLAGSGGTYTTYTASFEKTLSDYVTSGGDFAGTVQDVFIGSLHTALAESVLRQEVVYGLAGDGSTAAPYAPSGTGSITTNMKTRVVNIDGLRDFFLTQMDSDAVSLALADSTIYTPTPGAEEILAGDSSALVYLKDQYISNAGTPGSFTVLKTSEPGTGALATIYSSIEEGFAATTPSTEVPPSNLLPVATVPNFNGQQSVGTLIDPVASAVTNTMSTKGTVEAWIYMNTKTNTPGIVHKGTEIDFSDESFSLQGWGSTGQIGIVLDKSASTTAYDIVLSKKNLNVNQWYYIVATWDATLGNSSYIRLYINGDFTKTGNSGKPSVTAYNMDPEAAVIIGSQLPSIYSTAYGYFGFDGKIVGASVSATPLTSDEVLANYSASKDNTVGW